MRTLTWRINGPVPVTLRSGQVRATIQRACDAWMKAAQGELRLVNECSLIHPADIHFEFGKTGGLRFLSMLNRVTRRETNTPRYVIIFASHVHWNTGGWFNRWFGPGKDLLTYALHEIGHALGLPHSEDELSLMYSCAPVGLHSKPDPESARNIYALLLKSETQSWMD